MHRSNHNLVSIMIEQQYSSLIHMFTWSTVWTYINVLMTTNVPKKSLSLDRIPAKWRSVVGRQIVASHHCPFEQISKPNIWTYGSSCSDGERSPSVSISFEWNIYQIVELDELILVICSVFAHRPPDEKNESILIVNFFTLDDF